MLASVKYRNLYSDNVTVQPFSGHETPVTVWFVRSNRLTLEKIEALYQQGPEAVCTLILAMQEQIAANTARVKELEDRLGKDSYNSGKPPASDGLAKKPVSLRPKTGRKQGAEKGQPGRTLAWSEHPDSVVTHAHERCACCGTSLPEVAGRGTTRRQVVDLTPLTLLTTEHRVQGKVCPTCRHHTVAAFPEEVSHTVQYGPRLRALGVYLRVFQLLAYPRVAGLFAALFDASFSPATLVACEQIASERLRGVLSCIRQRQTWVPMAHLDETGLWVVGHLHWLHSASTPTLTQSDWRKQRGELGMDKASILPHVAGIDVHDGRASYQRSARRHALCNAQPLRELNARYERHGQEFAKTMRWLLVEIEHGLERAKAQGRTQRSPLLAARFEARYRKLVADGVAANPAPATRTGQRGRPHQNPARNLLERLKRFERATLRFLHDFAVPFDKNLAERDIRMLKVQQKVSGGFRSEEAPDAFCRLRSHISTMRTQGQSVLSALEHIFLGRPLCTPIQG